MHVAENAFCCKGFQTLKVLNRTLHQGQCTGNIVLSRHNHHWTFPTNTFRVARGNDGTGLGLKQIPGKHLPITDQKSSKPRSTWSGLSFSEFQNHCGLQQELSCPPNQIIKYLLRSQTCLQLMIHRLPQNNWLSIKSVFLESVSTLYILTSWTLQIFMTFQPRRLAMAKVATPYDLAKLPASQSKWRRSSPS